LYRSRAKKSGVGGCLEVATPLKEPEPAADCPHTPRKTVSANSTTGVQNRRGRFTPPELCLRRFSTPRTTGRTPPRCSCHRLRRGKTRLSGTLRKLPRCGAWWGMDGSGGGHHHGLGGGGQFGGGVRSGGVCQGVEGRLGDRAACRGGGPRGIQGRHTALYLNSSS